MTDINDKFLATESTFSSNITEFTILGSLYFDDKLQKKFFIIVIDELKELLSLKDRIGTKILETCRNDSMTIYSLIGGEMNVAQTIPNGNSAEYKNNARKESKNSKYVYCQTNNGAELYIDGKLDRDFQGYFDEIKKQHEDNLMKYDLKDLPTVLTKYQALRKIERPNVFFKNDIRKLDSSLLEQDYRNDLWKFLRDNMKGRVTKEENTFSKDDEESVDLAIVNKDSQMTIIEVKFIIESKHYDDPAKKGYSYCRFRDGYLQLNKYCDHLDKDGQEIFQTYLYMFYAHDQTDKIRTMCQKYYSDIDEGKVEDCPGFCNTFATTYKGTFLDNLLERFDYLILSGEIS